MVSPKEARFQIIDIDNAEGKYNIVLKNAKQPGKERVREVAKVGVDMSPPEISCECQQQLRVKHMTIKGRDDLPQSGVND